VNDTQRWLEFCETLAKRDGTPYDRADQSPDEYNVGARFYCAYSDGTPAWPIDWGTEGEYLGFRLY